MLVSGLSVTLGASLAYNFLESWSANKSILMTRCSRTYKSLVVCGLWWPNLSTVHFLPYSLNDVSLHFGHLSTHLCQNFLFESLHVAGISAAAATTAVVGRR